MGILNILNRSGDHEVEWDPEDEASVADAKAAFDAERKRGSAAFIAPGNRLADAELTREFKPDAERIVTKPPHSGG